MPVGHSEFCPFHHWCPLRESESTSTLPASTTTQLFSQVPNFSILDLQAPSIFNTVTGTLPFGCFLTTSNSSSNTLPNPALRSSFLYLKRTYLIALSSHTSSHQGPAHFLPVLSVPPLPLPRPRCGPLDKESSSEATEPMCLYQNSPIHTKHILHLCRLARC